jgi:uncharacterized protein YegL
MLDKSGSMTCKEKKYHDLSRWDNIKLGVSELIASLIRDPLRATKSKISIITHHHESKLKVEY